MPIFKNHRPNISKAWLKHSYCYCYARKERSCPVKLKIEYDIKSKEYRLYRIGRHNHVLKNISLNLKWDKILEREGDAKIENVVRIRSVEKRGRPRKSSKI